MTRPASSWLTACLLLAISFPAVAAEKDNAKNQSADKSPQWAAITPDKAGPDFAVQGEYTGDVDTNDGKVTYGVQVIALGDGTFHAVAYRGGLPGSGWDGSEKLQVDGKSKNGETVFLGEKATGIVRKGELVVERTDGTEIGRLKKVMRKSPTLGKKPPKDAVVLFDGTSADNFKGGRMTEDGLLMPGATSKQTFQDFSLHLEFMLSFMPYARGQGRSNSGVYMQGRYEVQILDSFGLEGKNNECGGIYETRDPNVNMCFPPLSWQTYDVDFTAARFDGDGNKTANAKMTVRHNGVVVHQDADVPHATRAAPLKDGPQPGPIYIQNHGNPLRFRNVWLVAKNDAGKRQAVRDRQVVHNQNTDDGYISLFDGKALSGWHNNPKKIGHGTGGHWFVEDGVIAGEQDPPGSGNGGILLTDRDFGDFELLIDMKPDWGVCSGLFLRSNDRGQCYQMMVDYHDSGNVGHIYGEGVGGFNNRQFSIFGVYDDAKNLTRLTTKPVENPPPTDYTISGDDWLKLWKVNDWNTAKVRVVGNPPKITTWINGVKVCEFDGTTFEQPNYDKQKVTELLGPAGHIAVQVHGGEHWPKGAKCRWRNVRIKLLKP